MPVRKEGFPVPPDPSSFTKTVKFCGEIPDLPQYRAALSAAVLSLSKWVTWNKDRSGRAKQSADYMKEILIPSYAIGDDCMSCGCCPGDDVYVDVQIQNVIDNLPPDYDPNDPGSIDSVYDDTDPLVQQAITAAMCEACKVWVAMYCDAIYQAKVSACADASQVPAWKQIANAVSEQILTFGAAVLDGGIGISAKLLALAGIEAGGLQILPQFLQDVATQFEQPACPPKRIEDEIQDLYACCLYNSLKNNFNWTAFRDAFDDPCQLVIDYLEDEFPIIPVAIIEEFEDGLRSMFIEWQNQPSNYMAMATLLPAIADNKFITPQLCDDCYDCPSYPELPLFDPFDDPRVTITPVPTIVDMDRYVWDAPWGKITLAFDDVYCMRQFNTTLHRAAASSKPSNLVFTIDGVEFPESAGGTGDGNINVTFGNRLGSVIEITPLEPSDNSANLAFELAGIYLRMAAQP